MNRNQKTALTIGGALGVVSLLLVFAGSANASPPGPGPGPGPTPDPDPGPPGPEPGPIPPEPADIGGREWIEILAARWGLHNEVRDFLIVTARRESGYNVAVMRGNVPPGAPSGVYVPASVSQAGRDSEQAAAIGAYNRNQAYYAGCGYAPSSYQGGAYGLFQMLPPNAMAAWWGTSAECTTPFELFRAGPAVIAALAMLARLQDPAYQGDSTFGALRMGWGSPSWVKRWRDPEFASRVANLNEALQAIGSPYTAESKIPRVSNNKARWVELLADWHAWQGPVIGGG
jgi:hypothetical protein